MGMGPNADGIWSQTEYERCYRMDDLVGVSREYWRAFDNQHRQEGDEHSWWRKVFEQRFIPVFGMPTGAQRILIVGCGLGMLVEELGPMGNGIDASAYVESLWPVPHPQRLRADIRTVTDQQLRSAFGQNTFTFVLTQSMMECYPPGPEQQAIYAACEQVLARNVGLDHVLHLVYPSADMTKWPEGAQIPDPMPDPPTPENPGGGATPAPWAGQPMENPGSPPRTLEEWRATRPAHTFLSLEGIM